MANLDLICIPDLTDQIVVPHNGQAVQGKYARIYKCLWNLSTVAVKCIHSSSSQDADSDDVRREIKIWARLQNEHIVPLIGLVYGNSSSPALVSPWIEQGSLKNFLKSHYNTLTPYEHFRLLQDIASALQYLHAVAVIHGDLTSNNILIDSDGRALVTNIGLSTLLDDFTESDFDGGSSGALHWMAPELFAKRNKDRLPTSKSDVWSFGCNMIHVLSGSIPWAGTATRQIRAQLKDEKAPPFPQGISEQEHLSFLRLCFSFSPTDRPSADQILAFVCEELSWQTAEIREDDSASEDDSTSEDDSASEDDSTSEDDSSYHDPCGLSDVMKEFNRCVFDQVPSHLIYVPEMRLISRDELATILKPEMITEDDISNADGWSRQSTIESKLIPNLLKYAILSHRWGESEPTFQDLKKEEKKKKTERHKGARYRKLHEFCKKAKRHGCVLAWSDTCCIDRGSSSELDEAIRSMYKWYRDAYICIVHLAQSESLEPETDIDEWFIRGWTLQELIAPTRMKFYGLGWKPLTRNENDKDDAEFILTLSEITKIPPNDLCNFRPGPNRAWEKMTWAAGRKTTRIEDIAYSLTGIFDITMTIAYGEGGRAFKRFMAELIQNCKEWQILVWAGGLPGSPTEPACYHTTNKLILELLKNRQISWWGESSGDSDFTVTKRGVQVKLLMVPVSIEEDVGKRTFLSLSPLKKLVVRSHYFPPASTTEWAIGIVNYHHRGTGNGILTQKENYMCFLLRRFRTHGTDAVRDHWRREVTKNILTVRCAHDFEKNLETVWL